jgi:hypothetical protein
MDMSIIAIIVSGATAIVASIIALFRNIKFAKFCCCTSECQKSEQELQHEEIKEMIKVIENHDIRNSQTINDFKKRYETEI